METWEDYSSFFIKGRAIFGSYPTQGQVEELTRLGVKYFIDLTVPGEVYPPYSTGDSFYINFPILDRKIPYDTTRFSSLTLAAYKVICELNEGELVYVHCKGGHGRAGILVAILLYLEKGNISTHRSIELTTEYHNQRKVMRDKWRAIGSPQTRSQKAYVHRFFGDLIFYRAYRRGVSHGFSSYSFHSITIDESPGGLLPQGRFPSAEAAFQASRNLTNKAYVLKHIHAKNPRISRKIGERENPTKEWLEKRYEIMSQIMKLKVKQHNDVYQNLMKTGLRHIYFNSRVDSYFGTGGSGGRNLLGKILMDIRNEKYQEMLLVFKQRNIPELSIK